MAKKTFDASAVGDMISGGSTAAATRRKLVNKQEEPKKQVKEVKLSVRVTPEMKERLDRCAEEQQRTVSSLVAFFMAEGLKKFEKGK